MLKKSRIIEDSTPIPYLPFSERSNINKYLIEQLSNGLSIRTDLSLGSLVRPSDSQEPVQRWFHYREGYTVELCRRIFSDRESFVVDPFCGFGSTLLAAKESGVPSAGLDVNPLAVFVSTIKTRAYDNLFIDRLQATIIHLQKLSSVSPSSDAPPLRILYKLFHPDILKALLIFRYAIERLENDLVREFLMLAWMSILENVSNVYREGNGIKYRNRRRKGNEYSLVPYDDWQTHQFPNEKFEFVRSILFSQLNMMILDVQHLSTGPLPSISQRDANDLSLIVPPEGPSLALFSPPYCNCFNYIKAYKLELWMAGFIRNYPDIRALTAMGIRSRTESLLHPVNEPYLPVIDNLVSLMNPADLWSKQLPNVVRGYFADMQRILDTLAKTVCIGGRCVIVVGNSSYGGILIPSDLLLASIGQLVGFEVEEIVITRHLTTSSQQRRLLDPIKEFMRESIIYLRRTH